MLHRHLQLRYNQFLTSLQLPYHYYKHQITSYLPGDPQKSFRSTLGLNFVLNPKSHSFRSRQMPVLLSNSKRIFSGLRSTYNYNMRRRRKRRRGVM